jgi:hypothetical protein
MLTIMVGLCTPGTFRLAVQCDRGASVTTIVFRCVSFDLRGIGVHKIT